MIKFPYGIREFAEIINGDYVYIDRTDKIRFMEEWGKELLFLRPRRFGKSLWLSTLMDYYDVRKADQFEQLFGHLAIGQEPTPLRNTYMVMRWDFSRVRSHGTIEQIETNLHECINDDIEVFQTDYEHILEGAIREHPTNALKTFSSALNAVRRAGYKLYLFIDEYDNFANEVMMSVQQGRKNYDSLVTGEGMFKTFFKNIKSFGSGNGLDRVFITGVSPIVMNDVTSGANVFEDVYWFQEFNDLCGFWEHEVSEMLTRAIAESRRLKALSEAERTTKQMEALAMMRVYYDGSWFTTEVLPPDKATSSGARLYNPTMVFYFLRYLMRTGAYPDQMLDRNLKADRGKLQFIASYGSGRDVLVDALNTDKGVGVYEIGTEFGANELLQENMRQQRLASLLCYLGALTIHGISDDAQILLTIPNLVMQRSYAERILQLAFPETDVLDRAEKAADELFRSGNIEPLCNFIEANHMAVYSNRDYPEFKELTLKSIFIAMLYYHPAYIVQSEPELNRRYGDLVLRLRPEMQKTGLFNLLFEFKQLPLRKIVEESEEIESADKKKSKNKQPLSGVEVKGKSRDELLKIPAVEAEIVQAKSQLRHYEQVLRDEHRPNFKLRSFAVVGIGVERVVWSAWCGSLDEQDTQSIT
ncbi:MAG: AAA family ATPase [Chloroflexota bacterium]